MTRTNKLQRIQEPDLTGTIRLNGVALTATAADLNAAAPAITPEPTIADAEDAHALNAVFSDVEVEGALDDLGAKVNEIIAALVGAGVIAAA